MGVDTRVCWKKWGKRYRETGYLRPCRGLKGDCQLSRRKSEAQGKGGETEHSCHWPGRLESPLSRLSESQFSLSRPVTRSFFPLSLIPPWPRLELGNQSASSPLAWLAQESQLSYRDLIHISMHNHRPLPLTSSTWTPP